MGIDINMPCGGQGRCGRCAVIAQNGAGIRRRSTVRLSPDDLADGYALACQTVIEGDAVIIVPPQEKIERRLVTDKTATKVTLPFTYDPLQHQSLALFPVSVEPPSMVDQTDDWSRLKRAMVSTPMPFLGQWSARDNDRLQHRQSVDDGLHMGYLMADFPTLRRLGTMLRELNWTMTAVVELDTWDRPNGPPRLVDLLPPGGPQHLWGAAVDIGTTTVSLYLVDLLTGKVATKAAEYNDQIRRGEDVISRIIYASKNDGLGELQSMVIGSVNELLERAAP